MRKGGLRSAVANWREIVEDYHKSGLSPSIYCRRKEIPVSTLSTWRKRYKDRMNYTVSETFHEVKFSETVSSDRAFYNSTSSGITFHINGNIRMSLERTFDTESFIRVIKIFREELC